MKKLFCLLLALCVMTGIAFASEDTPVLTVNGQGMNDIIISMELERSMALAAIRCASYGYDIDMTDPLTVADEMDKMLFDLELRTVVEQRAEAVGLDGFTQEEDAQALEAAEAEWQQYWDILFDPAAAPYLPAGHFEPTGDPDADALAYLHGFYIDIDYFIEQAKYEMLQRRLFEEFFPEVSYDSEEGLGIWVDEMLEWYAEADIRRDTEALEWIASGYYAAVE